MSSAVEMPASKLDSFKQQIVPKLLELLKHDGESAHYEFSTPKDSFYASQVVFVNVTIEKNDDSRKVALVAKLPPNSDIVSGILKIYDLLHNEIVFYTKLADDFDHVPKCIFTLLEPPNIGVIVVENIKPYGFNHVSGIRLSLNYIAASMRSLARFHGKAYIQKERHPVKFFKTVAELRDTRSTRDKDDLFSRTLVIWCPRLIRRYVSRRTSDAEFCEKVETLMKKACENFFQEFTQPEEPLATLCHGDFTKNNVLFKDNGDGKIEAMLIDFAMVTYGPPSTDISTIVHLSCYPEDRKERLNNILRMYHDSLLECLKEGGITHLEKYSFEAVKEDYKKHAILGYCIASFFLPILNMKIPFSVGDFQKIGPEEGCKVMENMCDESVFEDIADMLLELRDIGCLDHYL